MILPENGSVVVIDDDPNQAMPIILAMSKNGIATTYYRGIKEDELPEKPLGGVRLAIVDLQLLPTDNDGHTIATRLINVLQKIIGPQNGPYMLLVWSLKDHLFGEDFRSTIKNHDNHLVPVCIATLDKSSCLNRVENSIVGDVLPEILSNIKSRFGENDLKVIEESVHGSIPVEVKYEAKPDAIQIIGEKLEDELKKAGVFHLFIIWENLVNKAAADTVSSISNTIRMDELWDSNMKNIIKRLAKARTGSNVTENEQALIESLTILDNSFFDNLESKIRKFQFPDHLKLETPFIIAERNEFGLFGIKEISDPEQAVTKVIINHDGKDLEYSVVKSKLPTFYAGLNEPAKSVAKRLSENYERIPHVINTSLHLEMQFSNELMPGNVYKIDVSDENKQKYLNTYFEKIEMQLNEYQFIELEVSPLCDYAQTKWKKARLLSGLIYPANLRARSNLDNLYKVDPIVLIGGRPRKLVFDFQLFKSVDKEVIAERVIAFRLKRELLIDIIIKLSAQVNRAGISFVE